MAWSTIDAVGSNARPGSDVLIVNELSTTSVGAAVRAVEPAATTTDAVTTAAASDASSAPRLLRSLVKVLLPLVGCWGYDAIRRRDRRQVCSVPQPAGRRASGLDRLEQRLLRRAAGEDVGAPRMEAAAARRLRRIGNLARQGVGQEAASVRVRDRVD